MIFLSLFLELFVGPFELLACARTHVISGTLAGINKNDEDEKEEEKIKNLNDKKCVQIQSPHTHT